MKFQSQNFTSWYIFFQAVRCIIKIIEDYNVDITKSKKFQLFQKKKFRKKNRILLVEKYIQNYFFRIIIVTLGPKISNFMKFQHFLEIPFSRAPNPKL